jgi:hypothetical protein
MGENDTADYPRPAESARPEFWSRRLNSPNDRRYGAGALQRWPRDLAKFMVWNCRVRRRTTVATPRIAPRILSEASGVSAAGLHSAFS